MPPESGGICGRLTQNVPLGCLQGGCPRFPALSERIKLVVVATRSINLVSPMAMPRPLPLPPLPEMGVRVKVLLFFFFTFVTGPIRSLSRKLGDTRVYAPQIRARL